MIERLLNLRAVGVALVLGLVSSMPQASEVAAPFAPRFLGDDWPTVELRLQKAIAFEQLTKVDSFQSLLFLRVGADYCYYSKETRRLQWKMGIAEGGSPLPQNSQVTEVNDHEVEIGVYEPGRESAPRILIFPTSKPLGPWSIAVIVLSGVATVGTVLLAGIKFLRRRIEMSSGQVFLSYSRKDWANVKPYVDSLRDAGIDLWIDQSDVEMSDDLIAKINQGIAGSTCALIFFSKAYNEGPWTGVEMSALLYDSIEGRHLRHVFVVKLDDEPLPPLLAHRLWQGKGRPEGFAADMARVIAGEGVNASTRAERPSSAGVEASKPRSWSDLGADSIDAIARDLVQSAPGLRKAGVGEANLEVQIPGPAKAIVTVLVRALREELITSLKASIDLCATHRRYVRDYRQELEEGGLGKFSPGFKIAYERRLQQLDETQNEVRGYLEAVSTALTVSDLKNRHDR